MVQMKTECLIYTCLSVGALTSTAYLLYRVAREERVEFYEKPIIALLELILILGILALGIYCLITNA